MAEFDYVLEYKQQRGNIVADPWNRTADLDAITTTHYDIQNAIKDCIQHDLEMKKLMEWAA